MASLSERKGITEFLELYKNSPCLWDMSCKEYGNSRVRKQAFAVLLDKYKNIVGDIDMVTLKKKIDNLRTSYRREHRKTLRDRNHKPSLWYYPHLTFLNEGTKQSNSSNAVYSENDNDDNDNGSDAVETSDFSSELLRAELLRGRPSGTKEENIEEVKMETYQSEPTYLIKPSSGSEMTETDSFGRTIGLQLADLTPLQKTIAEKLISEVIYYARLDNLTTKTCLINMNDDFF